MTSITDQHETSPGDLDEHTVGNGNSAESRGVKRPRPSAMDDDDDDDEKGGRERRKIEIKFISDKSRRHITFSKRKAGIMKKVRLPSLTARPSRPPSHRSAPASPWAASHCAVARKHVADARIRKTGLRTVRPHRNASPATCRVGDGPRLHVHDPQATAARYQGRGQESYSGKD